MCDLPNCQEEATLNYVGLRVCENHQAMNERDEINLRDIVISNGIAIAVTDENGRVRGVRAIGW